MVPTKEPLAVRVTFFENTLDVLTDDVGIEFADVTSAKPRRTRKQPYVWDQPCTFPQVVLEPGSHVVLEVVKATEKDKNGQPVVRTCPRCRAVVAAAPRRVDWWLCTVVCGVSCCPTLWMPRLYCIACCPHPPNLFRWASTDCQCTLHWCLQLSRGVRTLCVTHRGWCRTVSMRQCRMTSPKRSRLVTESTWSLRLSLASSLVRRTPLPAAPRCIMLKQLMLLGWPVSVGGTTSATGGAWG